MKVAQNDETNLNTQSVCSPHIPSIVNLQHFTSGSFVRKRETPGILSRMSSPFTGITSYRVGTRLALPVVLLCTCLLCIYCFSPLFSLVDPVMMLLPLWSSTSPASHPSRQSNQARPPLWSSRCRPFHSLMLALDFAIVIVCSYSDA